MEEATGKTDAPVLPRYRKKPRGFLGGQETPAHFKDPKDLHHEEFVISMELLE